MTTEGIEGIEKSEAILELLGGLSKKARERAEALPKIQAGIDTRRKNAAVGLRVVERKLLDEEAVLAEEADQLAWILGGGDTSEKSIHDRVRKLPSVDDLPAPPPAKPPAPADGLVDTPRTPRKRKDVTEVIPATTPGTHHTADIRQWSGWSWLFAFLGAIVALLVATFTAHPLAYHNAKGVAAVMIMVAWYVALVGFGFFGGGLGGSFIESD